MLLCYDQNDLMKFFEIIQKIYSYIQVDCNANHSRLKHMKEILKKLMSSGVNSKTISSDPSNYQID